MQGLQDSLPWAFPKRVLVAACRADAHDTRPNDMARPLRPLTDMFIDAPSLATVLEPSLLAVDVYPIAR